MSGVRQISYCSRKKIISKCASVTKLFKVKEEQFENLEMPRNASFNRSQSKKVHVAKFCKVGFGLFKTHCCETVFLIT